jgi:hypothetical protein
MSTIADTQCAFESGRAFGKTATAFRAATGQRLRMGKAPKTYTIHRGTVRSAFALYHHVMPIYRRHTLANEALGKATAAVIESEKAIAARTFDEWQSGEVVKMKRTAAANAVALRAAQAELKNASARADEASKMHLVPFVPPYVPAKASRVFPALKTCTSPRRAAIASQRALFAASIGTPEQARASGFKWYETDIKNAKITIDGHEITGAYTETSLGYTAR